jgi:DNA topoisomerase IB
MPRLRRSDCSGPGIRRVRRGRGFSYLEEDGTAIADREVLERVRALAIPPAWSDVWICPHPRGHIQATGVDDAGRKQYRYHDAWRERQDQLKFDRMLRFARALPRLREALDDDLGRRGLVRERVLACAVRLLDLGLFRVGAERYAAENETYGLATLRRRHLRFESGEAVFDYRAKGGKRHVQAVADETVLPTLRALKRRPTDRHGLLAYRDGGRFVDVRSEQVNDYLRDRAGAEFTAKDFRTWNATVLAAVALARSDGNGSASRAARKRTVRAAVEEVAAFLDNTPAVCRSAYIDPRVIDRFESGETIRSALARAERDRNGGFVERERIEAAVVRLVT